MSDWLCSRSYGHRNLGTFKKIEMLNMSRQSTKVDELNQPNCTKTARVLHQNIELSPITASFTVIEVNPSGLDDCDVFSYARYQLEACPDFLEYIVHSSIPIPISSVGPTPLDLCGPHHMENRERVSTERLIPSTFYVLRAGPTTTRSNPR